MIELGDGLSAEEVIELLRRMHVNDLLDPKLEGQVNGAINALLMIQPILDKVPPFFLQFLPFPPGWREQVDNVVVLARIAKAVME